MGGKERERGRKREKRKRERDGEAFGVLSRPSSVPTTIASQIQDVCLSFFFRRLVGRKLIGSALAEILRCGFRDEGAGVTRRGAGGGC